MQESSLESLLAKRVKSAGGWCVKLSAQFIKGLPDRLILMPPGKAYFVEMKAPGEKPKKIQGFVHRKLHALGFDVEVLDSKEKIECYIKRISNPTK